MFGTGYVWVLSGPTLYGRDFIRGFITQQMAGCTKEELVEASMGHFIMDYSLVSRQDTTTISDKVGNSIVISERYMT